MKHRWQGALCAVVSGAAMLALSACPPRAAGRGASSGGALSFGA